ncbi:hypothetical protein RhiirA5_494599 [Rhizophagus irregularis]|uniref:Uncharacterized protein n=3 Tax=Rhizophagus irregularis TaxID=588596 RepID=A0A2I1EIP3_9GLOM|nr:hypothetical protein GLOIN_2v1667018 [Rhizophagus irregularis DAOM 181602=DAOM 197198]PKC15388.1 hypothetical protein RhiirA5_494599 [Rhizophagus irregularis]PKY21989.1 hypothetical protein RhiirB3_525440 [Rhizophagus irregularis]POG65401.1 hypothetical protein GLOIN_2v1667018 [Rhizophagus irregularis DAOM 181602=DAOM 197198]UZO15510.1 hypothetical protein OCT59_006930 [Rhizophagus irregularis]CAB5215425.1 unnamed protein product [Rhizophagus irregularis]|eukprot:XP_025172267.1 hypothetical protein GLOIN_2v1667018 [Rhizophagus irregularis DAOM 181602=DAOM 197198]
MFRNRIKHQIISFLSFIIWNVVFFSLLPLTSASVASFVDTNYVSKGDLYDATLNTFFPIFFVILFNVSGKPGSIKNIVLPLLDDLLYNVITWMIPLVVSFAYDEWLSIKIFSIINMCLHILCAVLAIIKWRRIYNDNVNFAFTFLFLILFPVMAIPIFWMIIIVRKATFDSTSIIFLTLFGICLVFVILIIIMKVKYNYFEGIIGEKKMFKIIYAFIIICFYVPNILQTLLIALSWPINFYFIKALVFILILSLTRNVSYFAGKVPDDFLATSTTMTQNYIKRLLEKDVHEILEPQITMEEMHRVQTEMQTKIDEMQKTINEIKNINGLDKKN